ncbi:hypothetical protein G6F66_014970 [Rhizopus arrhizus]|nr:hypothetical protein G6F66_014970 [Rhizopus arrhizus]
MSAWIRRAKRTAHSPASVGINPRLVRANSSTCNVCSSSRRALLAPGWVRPILSAAQEGAAFLDGDKQPELFGMEARHDGIQAGREVCHEQKL